MPVKGMRIGAFGWTGSYARKGTWNDDEQGNILYQKDAAGNPVLDEEGNPKKKLSRAYANCHKTDMPSPSNTT